MTVVPGFKALALLTALSALNPVSALNPGTILLSYKEIVFKLMVDLINSIFFSKKPQKNWRKLKIYRKITVFSVCSCKNHQITQYLLKKLNPMLDKRARKEVL